MLSSYGAKRIRVHVPATSANLGAGFDVLGLALDLHNVFTVTPAHTTSVSLEGYADDVPLDETNLFCRAFRHLYNSAGREAPPVHAHIQLLVPPGKGLGSSATAVVGGLVAANALMGVPFQPAELLPHAIKLEHGGHADNVAPALLGGMVVNTAAGESMISLQVPFPETLSAVVFTPDFSMDTMHGRALMPETYSKADVIFNTGRVALFLAAMQQGRYELLRTAMQDRIHQPYRLQLFPQLPVLIEAALDKGAHGACLSGGGSSVLALVTSGGWAVAEAMQQAGEASGVKGETRLLEIDRHGAFATLCDGEAA